MSDSSTDLNFLISVLQSQLIKLPEPLARYELLCAAQHYSQACIATIDVEIHTQNCVSDYFLDDHIPEGYKASGFEAIKYCGECIDPIDKCDPCPRGYELLDESAIRIHPEPRSDGESIELCINLRPTSNNCNLPGIFTDRVGKEILEKAKAELMLYVDKPWSDRRQAVFHLRRANASRVNEAVTQSRGYDRRSRKTEGCPVL